MNPKTVLALTGVLVAACSAPPETPTEDAPRNVQTAAVEEPTCTPNPLKDVFFGDLHVHTSYSLDAYIFGNHDNDPVTAHAFAQGATVTLPGGRQHALQEPLDFSVVSDHSEFMDVIGMCTLPDSNGQLSNDPYCLYVRWLATDAGNHNFLPIVSDTYTDPPQEAGICRRKPLQCAVARWNVWNRTQQATTMAYRPCEYTSLNAYEWSEGTDFMHRIVVFNGESVPTVPIDYIHYPTPLEMLQALSKQCTGECDAISIPHNSNLTAGNMFKVSGLGEALYRARYERLVEVFQVKGNSECRNAVDPEDDAYDVDCEFELVPQPLVLPSKSKQGYVRSGLKSGLLWHAITGINPLEMGMAAATDTHNAAPGSVEESTPIGRHGATDDDPIERLEPANAIFNGGGLTAVWAQRNTRDEIFAALKRRESYATSGPRMRVRFYQTWDANDPCSDPMFPEQVSQNGIPMGGRMDPAGGSTPQFVVSALKDEQDLAEIHFIKATLSGGKLQEQVVRFVATGGQASWCQTWSDPDFDATAPTLYYARVLEAPTWRWSHYDCEATPETQAYCAEHPELDVQIQERAWTSPIWSLP